MGESHSYLMPTYSFLKQQGLVTGDESASPAIVERVAPDSLADKVGIEAHSEITRVANQDITTYNLTDILGKQFGKTFPLEIKEPS